jgi:esterase
MVQDSTPVSDAATDRPALFHSLVAHEGARPAQWALFLHGILGSGANWRSFARRVLVERPGWGAVLVDLPMHGQSQPMSPPYTVEACARSLRALERVIPGPVRAVIGHSFGGKVALAYGSLRAREGEPLATIVAVDSNPGARDEHGSNEQIRAVLEALESLPTAIPSRDAFAAHLRARGLNDALVAWLMMNLRAHGEGFALRLDLRAIRALLVDYFARDTWDALEAPGEARVTVVVGGRSPAFGPADRDRLERATRANPDRVSRVVIDHAGHWVHVDAPDALHAIVRDALAPDPTRAP